MRPCCRGHSAIGSSPQSESRGRTGVSLTVLSRNDRSVTKSVLRQSPLRHIGSRQRRPLEPAVRSGPSLLRVGCGCARRGDAGEVVAAPIEMATMIPVVARPAGAARDRLYRRAESFRRWRGRSRRSCIATAERPRSQRNRSDEKLGAKLRASFLASDRTYGVRRVWHDLLAEGVSCGPHRIERLMRQQALKARPRRRRLPPDLGPTCPIAASKPRPQPQMDR